MRTWKEMAGVWPVTRAQGKEHEAKDYMGRDNKMGSDEPRTKS